MSTHEERAEAMDHALIEAYETAADLTEAAREAEHARLLKALQDARNYSYEATMSDYSMASINSAKDQVEKAKRDLINAGYEVPTW